MILFHCLGIAIRTMDFINSLSMWFFRGQPNGFPIKIEKAKNQKTSNTFFILEPSDCFNYV